MASKTALRAARSLLLSFLLILAALAPAGTVAATSKCPVDKPFIHDWGITYTACVGTDGDELVVYVARCEYRDPRNGACVGERSSETRVPLPVPRGGAATRA